MTTRRRSRHGRRRLSTTPLSFTSSASQTRHGAAGCLPMPVSFMSRLSTGDLSRPSTAPPYPQPLPRTRIGRQAHHVPAAAAAAQPAAGSHPSPGLLRGAGAVGEARSRPGSLRVAFDSGAPARARRSGQSVCWEGRGAARRAHPGPPAAGGACEHAGGFPQGEVETMAVLLLLGCCLR